MSEMRRIGIMGGTFNPFHMGHLVVSEVAREEYELDQIIFVPACIPPHKNEGVIDSLHRLAMVELAIQDNPYFTVSDVEIKRGGISYTIDTIMYFKTLYSEADFYFIAGTDTIHQLPNWKYIDKLLACGHFIGAIRPDGTDEIDSVVNLFGPLGKEKIHRMYVPELKLSATELRDRIQTGKTVRYMVPKAVREYILEHHIYMK